MESLTRPPLPPRPPPRPRPAPPGSSASRGEVARIPGRRADEIAVGDRHAGERLRNRESVPALQVPRTRRHGRRTARPARPDRCDTRSVPGGEAVRRSARSIGRDRHVEPGIQLPRSCRAAPGRRRASSSRARCGIRAPRRCARSISPSRCSLISTADILRPGAPTAAAAVARARSRSARAARRRRASRRAASCTYAHAPRTRQQPHHGDPQTRGPPRAPIRRAAIAHRRPGSRPAPPPSSATRPAAPGVPSGARTSASPASMRVPPRIAASNSGSSASATAAGRNALLHELGRHLAPGDHVHQSDVRDASPAAGRWRR